MEMTQHIDSGTCAGSQALEEEDEQMEAAADGGDEAHLINSFFLPGGILDPQQESSERKLLNETCSLPVGLSQDFLPATPHVSSPGWRLSQNPWEDANDANEKPDPQDSSLPSSWSSQTWNDNDDLASPKPERESLHATTIPSSPSMSSIPPPPGLYTLSPAETMTNDLFSSQPWTMLDSPLLMDAPLLDATAPTSPIITTTPSNNNVIGHQSNACNENLMRWKPQRLSPSPADAILEGVFPSITTDTILAADGNRFSSNKSPMSPPPGLEHSRQSVTTNSTAGLSQKTGRKDKSRSNLAPTNSKRQQSTRTRSTRYTGSPSSAVIPTMNTVTANASSPSMPSLNKARALKTFNKHPAKLVATKERRIHAKIKGETTTPSSTTGPTHNHLIRTLPAGTAKVPFSSVLKRRQPNESAIRSTLSNARPDRTIQNRSSRSGPRPSSGSAFRNDMSPREDSKYRARHPPELAKHKAAVSNRTFKNRHNQHEGYGVKASLQGGTVPSPPILHKFHAGNETIVEKKDFSGIPTKQRIFDVSNSYVIDGMETDDDDELDSGRSTINQDEEEDDARTTASSIVSDTQPIHAHGSLNGLDLIDKDPDFGPTNLPPSNLRGSLQSDPTNQNADDLRFVRPIQFLMSLVYTLAAYMKGSSTAQTISSNYFAAKLSISEWMRWLADVNSILARTVSQFLLVMKIMLVTFTRILIYLTSFCFLLWKYSLIEAMEEIDVTLCYIFFYFMPALCSMLSNVAILPHWTPHLITALVVFSMCDRIQPGPLHEESNFFVHLKDSALGYESAHHGGTGGTSDHSSMAASTSTPTSTMASSAFTARERRSLTAYQAARERDERTCKSMLRILRCILPSFVIADGFSSELGTIIGNRGSSRLTTAFMISLVRKNLISSPIGWVSWAIQVLVATYYPPGSILDQVILVIGLSSIRLVRYLEIQSINRVDARRKSQ